MRQASVTHPVVLACISRPWHLTHSAQAASLNQDKCPSPISCSCSLRVSRMKSELSPSSYEGQQGRESGGRDSGSTHLLSPLCCVTGGQQESHTLTQSTRGGEGDANHSPPGRHREGWVCREGRSPSGSCCAGSLSLSSGGVPH